MRLIDADKLVMHLADFALSMSGKTEYSTIRQCIKAVEEQPTADQPKELICSVTVNMDTDEVVERIKELGWNPVKHGRWVSEDALFGGVPFYCSVCEFGKNVRDERRYNYCPCCGAMMDL